tara:strand:- start:284 stop:625 length:342 start_codon:yes stop_codon:yes gene_type:complete
MKREFDCAYVHGDLFDTYDFTEDGAPIIGEAWGIYVGNEYGERLVHSASNFTTRDRKGFERAERLAKKVQSHLDAGGEINRDYWVAVDPCYGSQAYQDFGTEAKLIEWERAYD